jgi:tetratricopeptide (TPR) repeat protein
MSANSDPDRYRPVYFLLHIPKTAGQTVQVHLAEHCAPGAFWQSHRTVRPGRGAPPDDLPSLARARVISGHHIGRSLEDLFPGREIRRVLLLRDPLELQISLYNWQMMDNLAKGMGTYSFDLHLRALPRNFMAHFLLARWMEMRWPKLMITADEQKYYILNRMLAGFWFVGAHTDCDRLIETIGPDLGVPPIAVRRNTSAELQAQTGWRLLTADSLSPDKRAAIRGHHRIDQALWEGWRGAGFDTAAARPLSLGPGSISSFPAHEATRPWFALGQFVERHRGWWRRIGEAGAAGLSRANSARDAGEWQLAARRYRDVLRVLPNASAIWVQYGHALKEAGNVVEAEQAYRRAMSLSPNTADTHLQLGHALKLQGRIDEAIEAYLRSAALDPARRHARDELIGLGLTADGIEEVAKPRSSYRDNLARQAQEL